MPALRVPGALATALSTVLATALVSAGLAGCSGEPEEPAPTTAAAASESVSASPSESPTGPPPLPPEAQGKSRKAAVAFVRHWVDTLNYSADTLDSAPLRALSSPDCDACSAAVKAIQNLARRDGKIDGHEWVIKSVRSRVDTGDLVQVEAQITFTPSEVTEREGREPVAYEGGKRLYIFTVAMDGAAPVLADFFGDN